MDAQNVLYNKKINSSQKQNIVETKNTKASRPQSPLSPMIYSDIYDPLTKKNQSKSHSKKGSKSYFTLEDKFNNLDLLEQDVFPTPVQYGPQDSAPQPRNYRNPGDLISNRLFDGDDLVEPTLVGGSSRGSGMRSANAGGGGGDDGSNDSDSSDDGFGPKHNDHDDHPPKKGSRSSGGDDPPDRNFSFPGGDAPPGDHFG